jgi:hypothetical protein
MAGFDEGEALEADFLECYATIARAARPFMRFLARATDLPF